MSFPDPQGGRGLAEGRGGRADESQGGGGTAERGGNSGDVEGAFCSMMPTALRCLPRAGGPPLETPLSAPEQESPASSTKTLQSHGGLFLHSGLSTRSPATSRRALPRQPGPLSQKHRSKATTNPPWTCKNQEKPATRLGILRDHGHTAD